MYGEDGAELFITGLGSDAGSMLASATTSVAVINPTGVASTSLTGLPARASAAAAQKETGVGWQQLLLLPLPESNSPRGRPPMEGVAEGRRRRGRRIHSAPAPPAGAAGSTSA